MESFGPPCRQQSGTESTSVDLTARSSRDELCANAVQYLQHQLSTASRTISKLKAEKAALKAAAGPRSSAHSVSRDTVEFRQVARKFLKQAKGHNRVHELLKKHFPSSFQEQLLASDGVVKILRFAQELIRQLSETPPTSLERITQLHEDLQDTIERSHALLSSPRSQRTRASKSRKPTAPKASGEPTKSKRTIRVSIKRRRVV